MSCTHCGADRGPFTPTGHCATCAGEMCAIGAADRVGLPLPSMDAVFDLRAHMTLHDPLGEQAGCLVCALSSPECPECETRTDDMPAADLALHVTVSLGGGAADVVAVGCEGYVLPAVRAVALRGRS